MHYTVALDVIKDKLCNSGVQTLADVYIVVILMFEHIIFMFAQLFDIQADVERCVAELILQDRDLKRNFFTLDSKQAKIMLF